MKIELDLTPKEIDLLRQGMDALPLRPYAPIICKVLTALPIFDIPESHSRCLHGHETCEDCARAFGDQHLKESVAASVPGADAGPHAHTPPVSREGGFSQGLIEGLVAPWKLS